EDQQDIEDIRADDVAERDVGVLTQRGDGGGDQFGERGADGDDGQADDGVGYAEGGCEFDGAGDEEAGADQGEDKPGNGQQDGQQQIGLAGGLRRGLAGFGDGGGALDEIGAHDIDAEHYDEDCADQAV